MAGETDLEKATRITLSMIARSDYDTIYVELVKSGFTYNKARWMLNRVLRGHGFTFLQDFAKWIVSHEYATDRDVKEQCVKVNREDFFPRALVMRSFLRMYKSNLY